MAVTKTKKKATTAKKSTGRPCTVCSHKQVAEINTLISSGKKSLRGIALQYGLSHTSVDRHTEKCLGLEIGTILRERRTAQAIDVITEFSNLFQAALKGLKAATDSLTVDSEINFNPRSWEVEVVYEDWNDCDQSGKPKTKTEKLDALLALVRGNGDKVPQHTFVKVQDLRKIYLDAIKSTESLVDRFAKIGGLYQDNRPNDSEVAKIYALIKAEARKNGTTVQAEMDAFLQTAKDLDTPLPIITGVERMVSEAVN